MKGFKKVLGFALAVAMIGGQVTAVNAGSIDPETRTDATGNVLDYTVEKVVVPTAVKMTLNPNGYEITTRYNRQTSVTSGNTYYVLNNSGEYVEEKVGAADPLKDYYLPVTSSAQVISLNYGIANKSTEDKVVKVELKASYTASTGTAISFVDSEEKAQAYTSSNTGGAKKGELKMFLKAVSSTNTPTAYTTYEKTTDTSVVTSSVKYFTRSGSAYSKVSTASAAAATAGALKTYFERVADGTIGTEIQAVELADVNMTRSTSDGAQKFEAVSSGNVHAKASMAFKLGASSFSLKSGEKIDFSTTQDQLASKLEMSAIGGVAGFSITGTINPNADWTKADTKAITFTPVYTIAETDGTETAISGTHNQIVAGPTGTQVDTVQISGNDIYVLLVSGQTPVSSKLTSIKVNGVSKTCTIMSNGALQIAGAAASAGTYEIEVVYDGTTYIGSATK